ncbi:beta-glucosidase family protein [Telmatobacter bradus]|uniref:beta-glucosidase n=1 Tax=Telmatobacter bradus TaxID=474953 RepID=UPI003B43CB07
MKPFGFPGFLSLCGALALLATGSLSHAQNADRSWMNPSLTPTERADLVLKQMTLDEKLSLLHGNGMAHTGNWETPLTSQGNGGAGYVVGIPRLGIPPLYISDAAYGVRSSGENGRYSTALPSNLAAASSWDVDSACAYGALIGRELRAQGYDMTLGGGVNLAREPRNGRTFEYAGEDPLLAGVMVGNLMKCEQAQHVVGDIKHYAVNDQETGRTLVNEVIAKRAMQESDLLAFHIALSISHAAAVMCSYNRVNGDYACENAYTLNDVLKKQWEFPGFVLSDWGGTHSVEKASAAGLDQEQPMADFFGPKLKQAVEEGKVPLVEIDEHARRILYAEFASGIVDDPPQKSVVDAEAGLEIARRIEEKSIVLLKNSQNVLPLSAAVHRIALIGGHADVGMISGGGSAQVDPPSGNVIAPEGQKTTHWQDHVWFPTSPMQTLEARLPQTKITFGAGSNLQAAAELAKNSDVAIVFAHQWTAEGMDLPSLALSSDQNALIEAVAAANPRTIVVLENGTAVTMPWLSKVAGVVDAWFAGSAGHKALVSVLVGDVNPSGKLALSFPKSEQDLPHPVIPALSEEDQKMGMGPVSMGARASNYTMHYDEGARVGYKWYESEQKQPLFAFGFGLSYTSFAYSGLSVDAARQTVQFTVKNTGARAGDEIAEVYARLPKSAGESYKRLAGWKRLTLAPGQSQTVTVALDKRVLAVYDEAKEDWTLTPGEYGVLIGGSSDSTPLTGKLSIQ